MLSDKQRCKDVLAALDFFTAKLTSGSDSRPQENPTIKCEPMTSTILGKTSICPGHLPQYDYDQSLNSPERGADVGYVANGHISWEKRIIGDPSKCHCLVAS
jgi:hypothetical protein